MRYALACMLALILIISPFSISADSAQNNYRETLGKAYDYHFDDKFTPDDYPKNSRFSSTLYAFDSVLTEGEYDIRSFPSAQAALDVLFADAQKRFQELKDSLDSVNASYIHFNIMFFPDYNPQYSEVDNENIYFDAIIADKEIIEDLKGIIKRASLEKTQLNTMHWFLDYYNGYPHTERLIEKDGFYMYRGTYCFCVNGKIQEYFCMSSGNMHSRYTLYDSPAHLVFANKADEARYKEIYNTIDEMAVKKILEIYTYDYIDRLIIE